MKISKILILFLVVAAPIVLAAASELVGPMVLQNAPATDALKIYERIAKKTVVVTEEVKVSPGRVTGKMGKVSREEALLFIQTMLSAQAGITIEYAQDGTLVAKKVSSKK